MPDDPVKALLNEMKMWRELAFCFMALFALAFFGFLYELFGRTCV